MAKRFGRVSKFAFFGVWLAGLAGIAVFWPAHADVSQPGLPKLGERSYVLDPATRYEPVAIVPDRPATVRFLRDPARPGTPDRAPPPKVEIQRRLKRAAPVVANRPDAPGQLRFRRLSVSGSLVEPRVRFTREPLKVGRTDEPTRRDFMERVFDAAER